jgi:hypothetical protein
MMEADTVSETFDANSSFTYAVIADTIYTECVGMGMIISVPSFTSLGPVVHSSLPSNQKQLLIF